MKRFYSRKIVPYAIIVGIFIFFLWMCSCIPYTHDDWDWGLDIGWEQFVHATINSRYAGNFLVVVMTRLPVLKDLIMAVIFTLMPVMVIYTANSKFTFCSGNCVALLLFSYLLFFILPREVWAQTSGWISGFANYNSSAFMLSLYLFFNFKALESNTGGKESGLLCAAGTIVAIISQLFLENLAILLEAMSVMFFIVSYKKNGHVTRFAVCVLVGSLIGLAIVFSSSLYGALINAVKLKKDFGYMRSEYNRAFCVDIYSGLFSVLLSLGFRYGEFIISSVTEKLLIYNFIYLIFLLALIMSNMRAGIKLRCSTALMLMFSLLFLLTLALDARSWMLLITQKNRLYAVYLAIFGTVYYTCIAILTYRAFSSSSSARMKALLFWCSSLLVQLPLIIVMDAGGRLSFTPAVFIILAILCACRVNR